jgi:hypothetical protein
MSCLRRPGLVIVVMLCAAPPLARAGCPIALAGDAALVERVRAELGAFAEDGPSCVALLAQCRERGMEVEIDLHDEVGRSALHLFASVRGAAAFITSWSHRPLSNPAPTEASRPVEASARAAAAPPSRDPDWHPEIDLEYRSVTGVHTSWVGLVVGLRKRTGVWRYGGDLRAMTGAYVGNLFMQADVGLGAEIALSDRWRAVGELIASDTVMARDVSGDEGTDYDAAGIRGGVHAELINPMTRWLGLVVGLGYDVIRRPMWRPGTSAPSGVSSGSVIFGMAHIELGLRWTP